MAISYPLSFPSHQNVQSCVWRAVTTVGMTSSPFTGAQQVTDYSGQWWEAILTIAPNTRANFEEWVAFLLKLNGAEGYFRLGDPDGATPRGVATGTPVVDGAGQTGNSLDTRGWTVSTTGILKAGDYIQIGDYMYKVLNDADSDSGGLTTLDIWPSLRSAPADGASITTSNCKTLMRLTSNIVEWETDQVPHYRGLTITCREKL